MRVKIQRWNYLSVVDWVLDLRLSQLIPVLTLNRWIQEYQVYVKESSKTTRILRFTGLWTNFTIWSMETEMLLLIASAASEGIILVTKNSKKWKNKSKIWKLNCLIRRKYLFRSLELSQLFRECSRRNLRRLKSNRSRNEISLKQNQTLSHQKSNISTNNLRLVLIITTNTRRKLHPTKMLTYIMWTMKQMSQTSTLSKNKRANKR